MAQIDILGEKITTKAMQSLAEDILSSKYRKIPVTLNSFVEGELCDTLFKKNGQFYLNPTEALKMKEYVHEGDSFATVLGSGDFTMDALHCGAKNIVTFDINRLQYPVALLKLNALQVLNYDEYFTFFSDVESRQYFSPDTYKRISSVIRNPLLTSFWDTFMKQRVLDLRRLNANKNYNFFMFYRDLLERGQLTPEMELMMESSDMRCTIEHMNEVYFNAAMDKIDDDFIPLKTTSILRGEGGKKIEGSYLENEELFNLSVQHSKTARISYVRSNISALMANLQRCGYTRSNFNGFNVIYLSNIPEYMSGTTFVKTVNEQLMPLIKDGGSVVYCCQGVEREKLTNTKIDDFAKERLEIVSRFALVSDRDLFKDINEVNDIEAYQLLSQEYDISFIQEKSLCSENGNDDVDTFVRVMKK